MKICKNNFDICLLNVSCINGYFKIGYECKWLNIMGNFKSPCGGIKSYTLSDIFTL